MITKILKFIYRNISSVFYRLRRLIYTSLVKLHVKNIGQNLHVNYLSFIPSNTILGNNVNFNGMTIVGDGQVTIGNNFHSGTECLIISSNHNFDMGKFIPYDETHICNKIYIEDNVWIGSRVIILGNVTIGEGAIIQAGGVVVSDIPKYAIAGGNPAKVFKYRDISHYNKLKDDELFL